MNAPTNAGELLVATAEFITILIDFIDASDLTEDHVAAHIDFTARLVALETGITAPAWLAQILVALEQRAQLHSGHADGEGGRSPTPTSIMMAISATKRALAELEAEGGGA